MGGTSAAQAVAADDVIAQCATGVSESVCQSNPTAMQQHIEEGAVTSGRGQGKISGKRIMYAGVACFVNFVPFTRDSRSPNVLDSIKRLD